MRRLGVYMTQDSFFNFPGTAHNGGAVISFADGHVLRHRWQDPRTLAGVSPNYHFHNDASPGNLDLIWLRQRMTVAQ